MLGRLMTEGGGIADAIKQGVGSEADVKREGFGLCDEREATLGEDQRVDAGGDEIVKQVA